MSGLEQSISTIEENESISKDILQNIEQKLGDFYYEDFIDFFDTLSDEGQGDVLEIFNNNFDIQEQNFNPAFRRYIRKEDLPYDEGTLDDLKTKFSVEEQREKKDTDKNLENRQEVFEKFWNLLSDDPKYKLIFDQYSGESLEDRKKFLNENYTQLLDTAKEHSHTELLRVHKQLSWLQELWMLDLPDFEQYDIRLSESITDPESSTTPSDEPAIVAALWESNLDKIDWDIIHGTNGERVDISGSSLQLSLEWADGMILDVWEVEKIDTRNQEVQIFKLSKEKQDNERRMNSNEKAIWDLETAHSEFRDIPDEEYTNDSFREKIAKKFSSQSPKWEAMQIFRAAESASWVNLKNMVLQFLIKKIVQLSNNNVELSQRNSEITRDIGIFQAQIDSKRRLAAEKIYNKKEKVRRSQQFLEWLGVSRVIANASEIFAMIQPENPISLPNGDIITGVNFATMTFEWSFTPSLWDDGVNDIRTQEVLTQLMNKALTNSFSWPIELTWNGNIVYKLDGKIQDKAVFEAFVNELTWTGNMEMKIQDNLFDSEMIQDEKSMITPE